LAGLADAQCALVEYRPASGCYDEAMKHVRRALQLDETLAEAHTSMAHILHWHAGDLDAAEEALRRAIHLNPNYARAHQAYATLLAHTGRVEDAVRRSEIALALDPLSPELNATYAACLYSVGRLHEAADASLKALELDPDLEPAWWTLWYSLAGAWDWERAEAVTRECVRKHPDNPFAYVNLITCVMCRGRREAGLALLDQALALPGAEERESMLAHAGFHNYFGRRFDRAEHYLLRALGHNPANNGVRGVLIKCYILQGRFDEAFERLDEADRVFAGRDEFWTNHAIGDRGRIYALRGETEKAEAQLEKLLSKRGRLNRRLAVSSLLAALGRIDEALDWLEQAVDAHEPHVAVLRKAVDLTDAMMEHPRYQALLKRVGLAD
jgi:tetratricopeptide (TPR) repeat protein